MDKHPKESRTAMKCSKCCLNLALLSVAVLLIPALLSSQQEQNGENGRVPEQSSPPARGSKQDSKEICAQRAIAVCAAPSLETIVARMRQVSIQSQTRLRPYTVMREYELFERKRETAQSRVIADINFLPPDSRNYRIQQTEGSVIGEMIVRRVLGREAAIAKHRESSDISPDNYTFRFLRETIASGQPCYVLQLLPKRKDKNLLRGTIWVDANTSRIHRLEGEPEKNPSWWVRDVHIVLVFADVGGIWLPASSKYTATVRLLGPSTMIAHDLRDPYTQWVGSGNNPIEKAPVAQTAGVASSFETKEVH